MSHQLKQEIIALAAGDLEKIEKAIENHLGPNVDLVKTIAGHLLFSGGKRLRPLLMVHCARLCGYNSGFEIKFSALFEYLHAATLLHDDVVDAAALRRGRPAAHTRWSAPKVVLTGDFLLAKALTIAAETQAPDIIHVIANITREMSQGEIEQLDNKGRLDLTEEEYLKTIERKTAVLIQGACSSGAILAGADRDRQDALSRYGRHLGMAFQMADDLLDYLADAETLGKNPGADIREGKLTLPLIHSLARASASDRQWMEEMAAAGHFNVDQFEDLKCKLHDYGGIDYTREKAKAHVKQAKASLSEFEAGPSLRLLSLIADYSLARNT